jgi:hypothetical protein
LNPRAYEQGVATAGSYVAEQYMIGGVSAVVVISLLIGLLLNFMYRMSQYVFSLFFVVMLLPDILSLPRGDLLGWVSVLVRACLFVVVLFVGWKLYQAMLWLQQAPRQLSPRQVPGS